MRDQGLRFILPVLCGPYAEPLVSPDQYFWLRNPRFGFEDGLEGATPRVLTATELAAFLDALLDAGSILSPAGKGSPTLALTPEHILEAPEL